MKIITSIDELKTIIRKEKQNGKQIGFVPTMGYLHDGHLSLIEKASIENHFVVVSIFVNPTQFGINEDFDVYPRDLERDQKIAEIGGANIIFHPTIKEMYPNGYRTYVEVEEITEKLCGASRPGHFRGVTTVVAKLFHIVTPHRAYFGLKDAQQVAVLQKMVKDLNMDVQVIPCPIVREADGLAMSSRNVNLSPQDRKTALILSKSLAKAKEIVAAGERNAEMILIQVKKTLATEPTVIIDYIEIVDFETFERIDILKGRVLIAIAAKIGKVRLIDNIILEDLPSCI
ncbi:pantoate--beta-alanine ligase [Clostridium formicaceticum]|uniref:Pantothenate synthetase n=1 Tax=Clostridium formicaceticum TaxID=1497 RepID=A0AAC9WH17_9CLOT|nr:pantoate--beta-alanine ligase [Clostridium formicaceticum]AOY78001.1 pantoate--beta-alanine ligase [Clostridium formicaceticum]ARE88632.1 Pantothenate synthetase [Clostridium formicaceticum]